MFNGLIREIGEVINFDGKNLSIKAKYRPNLGDSIAVNGACLSVIKIFDFGFCVEISSESSKNLAIQNLRNKVHIEPAMSLNQNIDGHLMQGHIDFLGKITKITKLQNGFDFFIKLPKEAMKFVAKKGSIAIDGISLTINEIFDENHEIRLTIIPITMRETLFGEFKTGRIVNVETDALAKYVVRFLEIKKEISWEDVETVSYTHLTLPTICSV